ncbi:hypothetical protein AKJ08_0047 [Vulgatibacter incomptus]|uniref:Uncharacterized protein n=1 Tax=Vulgatibacter incomptus TaxID=1391653 RepID=A0A0K1P813_9BACT|nr:hypothetical protein AKJ08_0047 [Vulgatibacter incomptus]
MGPARAGRRPSALPLAREGPARGGAILEALDEVDRRSLADGTVVGTQAGTGGAGIPDGAPVAVVAGDSVREVRGRARSGRITSRGLALPEARDGASGPGGASLCSAGAGAVARSHLTLPEPGDGTGSAHGEGLGYAGSGVVARRRLTLSEPGERTGRACSERLGDTGTGGVAGRRLALSDSGERTGRARGEWLGDAGAGGVAGRNLALSDPGQRTGRARGKRRCDAGAGAVTGRHLARPHPGYRTGPARVERFGDAGAVNRITGGHRTSRAHPGAVLRHGDALARLAGRDLAEAPGLTARAVGDRDQRTARAQLVTGDVAAFGGREAAIVGELPDALAYLVARVAQGAEEAVVAGGADLGMDEDAGVERPLEPSVVVACRHDALADRELGAVGIVVTQPRISAPSAARGIAAGAARGITAGAARAIASGAARAIAGGAAGAIASGSAGAVAASATEAAAATGAAGAAGASGHPAAASAVVRRTVTATGGERERQHDRQRPDSNGLQRNDRHQRAHGRSPPASRLEAGIHPSGRRG